MKTLTEFSALNLKNAQAKIDELTASGKTAEELPAAITEALKVEGDKLKMLTQALEVRKKHQDGLKRILVMSLAENEKPPGKAEKHEELYYLAEFFPLPPQAEKRGRGGKFGDRDERGGRGGKRGDKRGGRGGRDGKRGEGRGPRGPGRGPRRDEQGGERPAVAAAEGGAPPSGEKRERRPRRERKPLPPVTPDPAGFKLAPKNPESLAKFMAERPVAAPKIETPAPTGTETPSGSSET